MPWFKYTNCFTTLLQYTAKSRYHLIKGKKVYHWSHIFLSYYSYIMKPLHERSQQLEDCSISLQIQLEQKKTNKTHEVHSEHKVYTTDVPSSGREGGGSFTIRVSTDVPILWVSFFSILVYRWPLFYRFGIKMIPFFSFLSTEVTPILIDFGINMGVEYTTLHFSIYST